MANELISLLDIAKLRGNDQVVGTIEEVLTAAPEFTTIMGREIAGTSYTTQIRTALPKTQFRRANEGVETGTSKWEKRKVECYILDAQMEADKAIADTHPFGLASFLADEAQAQTKSALLTVGSQFYYGNPSDTDFGFPGLQQFNDSSLVVDATGNSANACTSVYAVKMGIQGVHFVFGNGGRIDMAEEWRIQKIVKNNKSLTCYVNGLTAWLGLQAGSKYSVGRIKNLDGTKTLTDALVGQLLSKFPVGFRPDFLFMNRRAALQLQTSRSATTNRLGAGQALWAPQPTESNGIPIVVSDSIVDTEAVA